MFLHAVCCGAAVWNGLQYLAHQAEELGPPCHFHYLQMYSGWKELLSDDICKQLEEVFHIWDGSCNVGPFSGQ